MPSRTAKSTKSDEISLSSFLSTLRHDDELSDLTIEGSDGEKIRTNKCILASRSDVFRAMLFGDFAEAKGSVVRVGYNGRILSAIVDYCYTNSARLFDEGPYDEMWARTMVQLAAASDYFGLSSLWQKAFDLVCEKMSDEPALSCSIMDEAENVGDAAHEHFEFALDIIRSRTRDALLPHDSKKLLGIAALRPTALSKILADSRVEADEFSLFCALQKWSNVDGEAGAEVGTEDLCRKKRKAIASEQTKHIQLKRIKASDLCETVIPSGLVTADRVAEAFKAQALLLENTIPVHRIPRWEKSNSAYLETDRENDCVTNALLLCEPLVSGISTWMIEVVSLCSFSDWVDEIGVVHASIQCQEYGLAGDEEGMSWVIDSDGSAWHGEQVRSKTESYNAGCKIKFTLDLTSGGSITVSVDGKDPITLFSNVLDSISENMKPSFVPAVSLKGGASVRFLGFQDKS